jgi:hypothetical protein
MQPPKPPPKFKRCTKCKKRKPLSGFRIRKGSRDGHNEYLNSSCKKCDAEDTRRRYHEKKKSDPNFMEENRRRNKVHRNSPIKGAKQELGKPLRLYKDLISERNKIKRQTPKYKKYMRAYRQRRREIISEQEKITKLRYHEKHRDNITDRYAIRQLVTQGHGSYDDIKNNRELIELEKAKILKFRIRKEILKKLKTAPNGK